MFLKNKLGLYLYSILIYKNRIKAIAKVIVKVLKHICIYIPKISMGSRKKLYKKKLSNGYYYEKVLFYYEIWFFF